MEIHRRNVLKFQWEEEEECGHRSSEDSSFESNEEENLEEIQSKVESFLHRLQLLAREDAKQPAPTPNQPKIALNSYLL